MPVIELMPGAKLYQGDACSILFGCPPEIIKVIMIRGLRFPGTIVLPDRPDRNGVLQNSTEFPLYHFLFVEGNFQKGRRLNIIGTPDAVQRNRELLRLTLLGPTKEEYEALGGGPIYEGLYRESRALALKDKEGVEMDIDRFVRFIPFNSSDEVVSNKFTVRREGGNVFKVDDEVVDVNFTEVQVPPYAVNTDFVPMHPGKFGMDVLGGASGFTATKPCSGLLLNYNSDYMLVDCMPYLDYFLSARGVSRESVKSIFLSHVHDDHCNIFPLVLFNNKIRFLATKEIYWMAMKKLSLQTGHDMEEFDSYFEFVELEPYVENDFYGIRIQPHYTVHSIPTIGATFKMKSQGRDHTVAFVGDNKALPDIVKMAGEGIVSQEKLESINRIYTDYYDVIFVDGGGGILHGDPRDSLTSQADKVVFLHLEALPPEFDATFSIAQAGKRYMIGSGGESAYIIKTMETLSRSFPGMSEEWMTTLMNNTHITMFNSGDIIMKQGEVSKGMIFLILTGNVAVKVHDGHTLVERALKEAGDFIGEMAVVKRVEKRSASIVARTPVTLCGIPEEIFYSFLKSENRIDEMKELWSKRSEIEVEWPFSNFSDIVNERIAKVALRREIKVGETILEENEEGSRFYIIIKGEFEVSREGERLNVIRPGEVFGEYGSLEAKVRNASVTALTDGVIFELSSRGIKRILDSTPGFHFIIRRIFREREEVVTNA